MRNACVIAKREVGSYFSNLLAYIILAVFLILVGVLFVTGFVPGAEASLRVMFTRMVWVLALTMPFLTMPLLSDEYSRGTIEAMMTAPVTEVQLVLGKFFGAFGFFLVLMLTTVLHLLVTGFYSGSDTERAAHWSGVLGQAGMAYLGMFLVGAMFIAVGLFFSSVTRYQLVAAIMTVAALASLTLLPPLIIWLLPMLPPGVGRIRFLLDYMGVDGNFDYFARGALHLPAVVYFVTMTLFFLFVSVKVVESRRWR